ncbi:MAG: hypothetical protein AABZ54_01040, partial [Bacteroidota bacterium]
MQHYIVNVILRHHPISNVFSSTHSEAPCVFSGFSRFSAPSAVNRYYAPKPAAKWFLPELIADKRWDIFHILV